MHLNWLSPKANTRHAGTHGHGTYALEHIARGETVVAFGGAMVSGAELDAYPSSRRIHSIQIDDDLWCLGAEEQQDGDYVNHSCDPSCGLMGALLVVALRDIEAGEEITFDYAMSDSTPYDEFTCVCGASQCRGAVTAHDWRRPELQARYEGWFSPYLARRIAATNATGEVAVA